MLCNKILSLNCIKYTIAMPSFTISVGVHSCIFSAKDSVNVIRYADERSCFSDSCFQKSTFSKLQEHNCLCQIQNFIIFELNFSISIFIHATSTK